MEDRLAIISIIVSKPTSVETINNMLHEYASSMIARFGIPCREYGISVISIVIHGTPNKISTIAGSLGKIDGVKVKSMQTPIK